MDMSLFVTDSMRREMLVHEYNDAIYPYVQRLMELNIYGTPRGIMNKEMTKVEDYDVIYPDWVEVQRKATLEILEVIKQKFEEKLRLPK
jgi:hypothetical protein